MEKFQIPEAALPYTDALRKLISTGVTAAPSLEHSPLIELTAVTDRAGKTAGKHDKSVLFTELLAELTKDGSSGALMGKDRDVAVRLFGLHEWAGVPSRKRYDEVAKLYDKHWTWENFRKEPLERHLYAVYLTLYRQAKSPVLSSIETAESGSVFQYKMRDYDVTYRLPGEAGQVREILEVREVEALVDDVHYWRASSRYWGMSPDASPDITLFGPGRLDIAADASIVGGGAGKPGRAYVAQVTFPRPLKKGERIRFTLLKRQPVEVAALVTKGQPSCQSVTPSVPIDRASIRVSFPEKNPPIDVWQFADLEDWLVPGVSTEANRVHLDSGNSAATTWHNLRLGTSYGIGWQW